MKKIFIFITLLTALSACNKEESSVSSQNTNIITAQIEQETDTKTYMDAYNNICWSEGDQIVGFMKSSLGLKYRILPSSVGKTYASFENISDSNDNINAGIEWDHNVVYYPYSDAVEVVKSGPNYILDVVLPSEQTYAPESFANGSMAMVAVSEDNNFTFKNVLGGMKLQLLGTQNVKSIKLEGNNYEKLSGAATVKAFSDESNPFITMASDASTSVTLNCGEGVHLNESRATDFIIALPPVTFEKGFTIIITDTNNQDHSISTEKVNTVLRSSLLVMPIVDLTANETEGTLTLEVDKLIIQSNGTDASTLTVKFNGKALTDEVVIFDAANKPVDLGTSFKFTTAEAGEFTFYANYKTFISNKVTITAVTTPVPDTPADPKPSSTSFVRKVLITKFTGEQCQFCPNATAALHKFFDEHELAANAVKAEAHTFSSDDPAYFGGKFYSVSSFPTICVDWSVLTSNVDYNSISSIVTDRYESEDAKVGISVNSVCADGAITFKVCVKAAETGQYRVGAWLLEDNIKGQQKGAPVGEENSWYHEFDDCIRIADSRSGTSYAGIKLGNIEAGKTAEKMFAWTLKDGWKVENLKLCVFVSVPDEKGYSYVVNNVITAPINGQTPFEYID